MKNFDYTKKEFCERFPAPEIKSFFKHLDRKTINNNGPNFYKHWGISDASVREPYRKHFYEIPVEASNLYAELIRIFDFSYGADRRGIPAKKEVERY